jgi:ribosomal protein S18 acetylase RimI-like enzyme
MGTTDLDGIHIRRANGMDRHAVLALVPRLVAFGPPAWRDIRSMSATDAKVIGAALDAPDDDPQVFVAVEKNASICGFLHVHSVTDYYTERKHGHVADIVVATEFEARGVGRALLKKAEEWARMQGYSWLTISVFHENTRAVRTYAKMGFCPDVARLLKVLD